MNAKAIGQSSRSQAENVDKVASTTSSEGFFVVFSMLSSLVRSQFWNNTHSPSPRRFC